MTDLAACLTIIGDVGVDVVLGPIDRWPRIGTESLMDRSELRPGGSGGNTALAVQYLGARCRLLSLVGNDDLGAWLIQQFRGIAATLPVCNAATSLSVGVMHSCGERTIFTTKGHLEKLAFEHIRPLLTRAPDSRSIVLLSGVFLTPMIRGSYGHLIDELAALGFRIALDTGWPSGGWNDDLRVEVARWIGKCDHVLLNELEISSLVDRSDLDGAVEAASRLLKPGASLIVKTGPQGAIGFQGGRTVVREATQTVVVDTIGAGDSFNAGYLLARLNGHDLDESLRAGCNAAASVIARFPRRQIRPGEFAHRIAVPALEACGQ
jgi:sugar/nucleoside kinase (ribokinase family)